MSETMVFRFHSGQSLRASIECEAPLYYNLRDTAGNPLIVSKDRVREIVPLADIEPCPDAFSGAATDPGHSWDGDVCSLCGKSRKAAPSAFDRLSRMCGPQVPPELLALLDELRAEVRTETLNEAIQSLHEVWRLAPESSRADGINFAIGALMANRDHPRAAAPAPPVPDTTGDEGYPGELEHLRSLLRDVGRLADSQPKGNPLTELLIDHYSDSRMVDAQLAKEQAAVRRSVDAQFPIVAAFLAEGDADSGERSEQPHCPAEYGGPGYTHCELTAGHDGQHESALGNMRCATWGGESR